MSLVKGLQVNSNKDCVTWHYNGQDVMIRLNAIGQALEDVVHQKIVVSVCDGKYPKQLKVFSLFGSEECTITAPEQFQLYFLQENSMHGVSVVCTSDEPIDGRFDWQFLVLYPSCELKRFSPSY